jgi:hypothetical protein
MGTTLKLRRRDDRSAAEPQAKARGINRGIREIRGSQTSSRQKNEGQKDKQESHFSVPYFSVSFSGLVAALPRRVSAVELAPENLRKPRRP